MSDFKLGRICSATNKMRVQREYEFKYFVLDEAQFNKELEPNEGYEPQELLRDQGRTGKDIVNALIKVDFLHAQRHLSDSEGGSRAEELSRHFSRYYQRNLQRHADDYNAIRALADSEILLNQHLEQVFADTLQRLARLGYPRLSNPRLMIKSALNPAAVMNSHDGAHVHCPAVCQTNQHYSQSFQSRLAQVKMWA